ncbi:hypothetical protein BJF93_03585 [Xaviernesmea oryzae]|uniref:Acyltransferase n=1 Tax=Xaviernesmea oryzae TaxID=464029 RepID=A0A1Q9AU90_9HYPH|nr:acyltransferase family protein [Xaviernesmea oryzae]OLP59023.1 hypothetical protein BJF93_03585 [Xaviernesmea oryzae]SEK90245.1 Peptidoglycan/LPS O-acetylase OafA/YrhL, contains acyltransferase and SGNH-hydrolase domains [Xaviernesmea oryzae]
MTVGVQARDDYAKMNPSHEGARAQTGAVSGYRADIDGLRAIAVGAVVIFHTGISPLRGGFVGVDIFLVISGYLISGILLKELGRGGISLAAFYERRVRRILPAMLVMIAVVLAAAPFFLFHPEIRITALTAIASLVSAANLYLLSTAGYFEADVTTQPLLHMWSLGVEEQFYLFFPLLLIALRNSRRMIAPAIAILAAASFVACVVLTYYDRDAAYYFPLTRAWELMAGALLVVFPLPKLPRWMREAGALAALGLLAVSLFKIHGGMAFPGYVALAPCAAAAALMAVGGQGGSAVSRLLALPPMAFLGRISYSLYLWHWPIFVGYRLWAARDPSPIEAVLMVLAAVLAAILSWRFVEQPFRTKTIVLSRKAVFTAATGVSAALAAIAGIFYLQAVTQGAPRNEAERLASYLAYDDTPAYRRGQCFLLGHRAALSDYNRGACATAEAGKPNILLVGDSHAAHLWKGLNDSLPDAHVMQTTITGCKPVFDSKGEKACTQLINLALGEILEETHPDLLILSARWIESDIPNLESTLARLRGKVSRILVSGPIVEYAMPLPRLLAQVADGRSDQLLLTSRQPDPSKVDADLERAATAAGASYFSTYRTLCPDAQAACQTVQDGVPMQFDYGHLTQQGSEHMAEAMKQAGVLAVSKAQ